MINFIAFDGLIKLVTIIGLWLFVEFANDYFSSPGPTGQAVSVPQAVGMERGQEVNDVPGTDFCRSTPP